MPVVDLLPLPQAALRARVSMKHLTAMAQAGTVTAYRVRGRLFFRRDDLAPQDTDATAGCDQVARSGAATRSAAGLPIPDWDVLATFDPDTELTPAQVIEVFKVGHSTLRRWTDQGRLGSVRTEGGHRRYPLRAIYAALTPSGQLPSSCRAPAATAMSTRALRAVAVLRGGPLDGAHRAHAETLARADDDGVAVLPNPPGPEASYVFVRGRWRHVPVDDADPGSAGAAVRTGQGDGRSNGGRR